MAKKKRGFQESFLLNQQSKNFHSVRTRLLALNMFEWEGLPNNIPQRFIEKTLYENGIVALANDKLYDIVCCKCVPCGKLTMYGEHTHYHLFADNGYSKVFRREDIVLIRNNKDEIPTQFLTEYYVKKFTEIDRTIDTNVIQQKTSRIVQCSEEQRLTLENLFKDYEGNVPFIFGNKFVDMKGLESIDLTMPYVADKLYQLKYNIWRECLDTIGINNSNTEKKERVNTAEVESNNQLIDLAGDVFHESRLEGQKEMNEKWGCNASVRKRVDLKEVLESALDDEELENEGEE